MRIAPGEKMNIVVVDDIPEYLHSLSRALEVAGSVTTASTFDEAKSKIDSETSVALIDIRLSESDPENRDGILLLQWIREKFPQVKVVLMSAYRDFDATVDALNLGAVGFLRKPVNIRELKLRIRELTL
jgi:DNA-binding response OmpR family regulator